MRALLVLAAITLLVGGAGWASGGALPGDVALTQGLQAALGSAPPWAFALTRSAVLPLAGATVVLAAMLGWWLRGVSGSAAVLVAYGLALAADKALRAVLFVPRPAEPLVAVAAPSASSGLPSTFGLVYGALFGLALQADATSARMIAASAIITGAAARIVLGGHWPSQMIASLCAGALLALLALRGITALARIRSG
ncbi:MAG: hypothetical protein MUF47_04230 [Porphyrobacter sp.]|jgi:membrane-associated phospholipid phosphatase|nr:hypothetical protein [Porphyrobacter sp.]